MDGRMSEGWWDGVPEGERGGGWKVEGQESARGGEKPFGEHVLGRGRETDNAGASRYIALLHQHPSVGSVATPFRTHPVPQQQSWSVRDHGVWMYGGVNRLHGCAGHGKRSR
jgi:hypothetical protein